jgi:thymidylate kinase
VAATRRGQGGSARGGDGSGKKAICNLRKILKRRRRFVITTNKKADVPYREDSRAVASNICYHRKNPDSYK